MKNIWKVMAAMMVIALPFIVSSCSSDDEDNGPWTLTYFWRLEGVDLNSIPVAQLSEVASALTNIDDQIAKAYQAANFKTNLTEKQFSVEITKNDDITIGLKDSDANNVFMKLVSSDAFQDQLDKITVGEPKMYIWRDGKEIIPHMSIKIERQNPAAQ